MASIDNRVVEMKFNNSQFERGVRTTLSTLEKLKNGLKFKKTSDDLSKLDKQTKSIKFDGIASGLETLSQKFSALGIVGITTLMNLTNRAVDAGLRISRALTIDPIMMGFEEYETQLNAVQTILANTSSKGSTLKDVNAALNELNHYADKTIYNFTEMTRNIGTFTAAGVDLDTSVSAIKGIANLAAVSGSTSQQASTAMYQLSQALAAGTVKLQDWNSVVNAGMGGQVFQDSLKETARVHGVKIDEMIKKEGSFRETLSKGWLTTEILTETLNKFTGDLNESQLKSMGYTEEQIEGILKMGKMANDAATKVKTYTQLMDTLKEAAQSGWTESWQLIIGDFEEAKEMWTAVSDTIGDMIQKSSDARNAVLREWKALGGRTALLETIKNAFQAIMGVITPIKEAFREVFPPLTGKQLYAITVALKNFTSYLKMGAATADKVKRIFKGLFSILSIGVQAVKALAVVIGRRLIKAIKVISGSSSGILEVAAKIGDFITNIAEALKATNGFEDYLEHVVFRGFLDGVIKFLIAPLKLLKDSITQVMPVVKSLVGLFTGAGGAALNAGSEAFGASLNIIVKRLEPLGVLGRVASKILSSIVDTAKALYPIFAKLAEVTKKAFTQIGKMFKYIGENVNFKLLLDLFNAGLVTTILMNIKKLIKGFSAKSATEAVKGGFLDVIKDSLGSLTEHLKVMQQEIKAKTLFLIAGAIALLTASVVALSMIDSKSLTKALTAISVMFVQLFGSMGVMQKVIGTKGFLAMPFITGSLIGLSTALLVLTAAVKNLSGLDWNELVKGLTGVVVLITALTGAVKFMPKSSRGLIKTSIGLTIFALAIRMLVKPVKELGGLDLVTLSKGLTSLGIVLTGLVGFLKFADFGSINVKGAAGIFILSGALLVLSKAVKSFGNLSVKELVKGLGSVASILSAVAIFAKVTGDAKGIFKTSAAMVVLGGAMIILAKATEMFGKMSVKEIAKGLTAMAGALVIITAAMYMLPKNIAMQAVSLVAISSALTILATALNSMGNMSWEEIGKGLLTLGGALAILSAALIVMNGTLAGSAALIIAAGALAILTPVLKSLGSMSLPEIGKSLLVLAGAFAILGAAGLLLTPALPGLLGLAAAIALLGAGAFLAGAGVMAFSVGVTALAASGAAAASAIGIALTALTEYIPVLVQALGEGLIAFITVIGDNAVTIVDALKKVLLAIIKMIVEVTPKVIEALVTMLLALIDAIVKTLPKLIQAGVDIILSILRGIRDNIGKIVTIAADIMIRFLRAIANKLPGVINAGVDVIIAFIRGIGRAGARLANAAFETIIKFVDDLGNAIDRNGPRLASSAVDLAGHIISGMIRGLGAGVSRIASKAWELGKSALSSIGSALGIASPSKEFAKIGRWSVLGFANGLSKYSNVSDKVAKKTGESAIDAIKKAIENIDNIDLDNDYSPVITPVIDFSKVEEGSDYINGLMNKSPSLSIESNIRRASGITWPDIRAPKDNTVPSSQSNISFVQNNYSPKALSRIEIYRQTRNQLGVLKGK